MTVAGGGGVFVSYRRRAMAAADPDRAERIAGSITDKLEKTLTLSGIAQVLVATPP